MNERLIEHEKLVRGLEDVSPSLQFMFAMLTMPRQNVDVNGHTARRTIKFLGEAEISGVMVGKRRATSRPVASNVKQGRRAVRPRG